MNNNPDFAKNLKPFKPKTRPYSKDEFEKKYNEGLTITELALYFRIGRKMVQNDMKSFGIKARPAVKRNQRGENNSNWKGDAAGYSACHRRLYGNQPNLCEECGSTDKGKLYQWASLTGNYHDPDDYRRLCKSCHAKFDKMEKNFA